MKRRLWLFPLIAIFALASCAKAPKAEVEAAEAAVARAEKAPDVAAYAPEELKRAQNLLADMRKELAAKRYDKAKAFAASAKEAADAAVAAAPANKDRAKGRAASLIETAKSAYAEVDKLLKAAAKLKKSGLDLPAKNAALVGAKSGIADAEAAYAAGDYLKAADIAAKAEAALAELKTSVGLAVQATTRKK